MSKSKKQENHRFLDEAGDTTFFGKKKKVILGDIGVSKCFILGMVKFKEPLDFIRKNLLNFNWKSKVIRFLKPQVY